MAAAPSARSAGTASVVVAVSASNGAPLLVAAGPLDSRRARRISPMAAMAAHGRHEPPRICAAARSVGRKSTSAPCVRRASRRPARANANERYDVSSAESNVSSRRRASGVESTPSMDDATRPDTYPGTNDRNRK
eukprot:1912696-Prymnesium_polylepis.1